MTDLPVERAGWSNSAQSADEDNIDHAEMEELISAARFTYCGYDDGSGDDGNPTFALIQIEGQWTSVCALHATAAAAGEMERNWTPTDLSAVPPSRDLSSDRLDEIEQKLNVALLAAGPSEATAAAGSDLRWLISELRDARTEAARWREAEFFAAEAGAAAIAERDDLRVKLAAVREWATGNYGGAKRPIDIWPGLAAALTDGGADND